MSDFHYFAENDPEAIDRGRTADLEIPPCPSCCETDEVALVFDGVQFDGYQCERCDLRFSEAEAEKSRRAEG